MAVPSLGQITGDDIPQLINSLEKQRKELEFILSSLDATNILEISADLINSGTLGTEFVDLANINVEIDNLQDRVVTLEGNSSSSGGSISALNARLTTAETDINAAETRITATETQLAGIPAQIQNARIIQSVTSDPVSPVVGQMWLRSDL